MGFSVTATHAIFLVALLGVGSAAATMYWSSQEQLDESRRVQAHLLEARAHTNLSVTASVYDGVNQTYTVDVFNGGSTTLRISELHYLLDGRLVTDEPDTTVEGDASTDLWLPGETLVVRFAAVTTAPTYFQLSTDNGSRLTYEE